MATRTAETITHETSCCFSPRKTLIRSISRACPNKRPGRTELRASTPEAQGFIAGAQSLNSEAQSLIAEDQSYNSEAQSFTAGAQSLNAEAQSARRRRSKPQLRRSKPQRRSSTPRRQGPELRHRSSVSFDVDAPNCITEAQSPNGGVQHSGAEPRSLDVEAQSLSAGARSLNVRVQDAVHT